LVLSGFNITIPVDQFPQLQNHSVRVFASIGDQNIIEVNYNLNKKAAYLYAAFNKKTNRKIPKNKSALMSLKINDIKNLDEIENIDTFDDDFKQLSIGDWFAIDKQSRWIGSNAAVIVPVKEGSDSLTISINAKPLIYPGKIDKQSMIIYANKRVIKTIEFRAKDSHEIVIDLLPNEMGEPVIIKLEMPDSVSPSDYVESNDKRKLSLFISDFRINFNKEKQK
jgi:hypothetical protein